MAELDTSPYILLSAPLPPGSRVGANRMSGAGNWDKHAQIQREVLDPPHSQYVPKVVYRVSLSADIIRS